MTGKTWAAAVAAAGLVLAAAGCGGSDSQITGARVKGTVTAKGKPVTGAEIVFTDPQDKNKSQSGRVNGDGTFDVPNVPLGDMVVTVNTELAKYDISGFTPPKAPAGKGGGPAGGKENPYLKDVPASTSPPMKFMAIDKKYAKPDSSPLRMTVQKGTNEKNFEVE